MSINELQPSSNQQLKNSPSLKFRSVPFGPPIVRDNELQNPGRLKFGSKSGNAYGENEQATFFLVDTMTLINAKNDTWKSGPSKNSKATDFFTEHCGFYTSPGGPSCRWKNWGGAGNPHKHSGLAVTVQSSDSGAKFVYDVGHATKTNKDMECYDYGETFELGNEALGFIGARAIPVRPERSLKFKIAEYQRGVSTSRQLFTTEVLKGGPVTPEAIVNAYINANRALFKNTRDFYRDLEAAEVLNMPQSDIAKQVIERTGKKTYGSVTNAIFRPLNISDKVMRAFQENADKLGIENPFIQAAPILGQIKSRLFQVPLTEEGIPEIVNPLANLPEPNLGPVGQLPPVVTGANPSVVAANQKLIPGNFNSLTQAQKYEILFGGN